MLGRLRKLNPDIQFFSVNDEEFSPYGKVIKGYDVNQIIDTAMEIKMPESGSSYELSTPQLEKCDLAERLKDECFGESDIQIGYCWGYNEMFNGLEYHKSSEINIATMPMVLLLGYITDIKDNLYNTENIKAFFVDKGEMIEIYGTTLHFCPCQANKYGFGCIVVLPKGTNAPLNKPAKDKVLFRQNKWLLCHYENEGLIQRGVYPGIKGKNIKVIGE